MPPSESSLPDRPAAWRLAGWAYRALASVKLAVLLISASAAVLAWATFVERSYGTQAVHFGIYGTWWFAVLVFGLGLNVLCAALIRFPWRKHQLGFVVTHAGILVLLAGCWLSWLGGIDAQMPIFEQTTARRAFVGTQHFELAVYDSYSASDRSQGTYAPQAIRIPFAAGPFNWNDYQRLSWFPWRLSRRDRGVVYDRDGIRLEVLDYLSDSTSVPVPPLKLEVQRGPRKEAGASAKGKDSNAAAASSDHGAADGSDWQTVELSVQDASDPHATHRRMGLGARQELPGGQQIAFWVADSQAETDAFLDSRPDGPLGSQGQIILFAAGTRHVFPLDSWKPGSRMPVGDTGLQVELAELNPRFSGVSLQVIAPGEKPQRLMLLADYPEFNRQDREHAVFGTYWRGPTAPQASGGGQAEPGALRGIGRPRIDILQGAEGKLYYRAWRSPQVESLGPLPGDRASNVAFAGTQDRLAWRVAEFTPCDRPGEKIRAVPFSPKKESGQKLRRALVALTVDGTRERFWLDGIEPNQFEFPPHDNQRKVVCAGGRRAAVTLARDEITVGFRVHLLRFNRKLDPGTSMASHYSSEIVFLADNGRPPDPADFGKQDSDSLGKPVVVTLNEPVTFTDPRSGRSYRLFQESFAGPWKPGDEQFDQIVPAGSALEQLFVSFLTVNYDPGRGLKYAGSLLLVAGVGVIFYMRAYYFRHRRRRT